MRPLIAIVLAGVSLLCSEGCVVNQSARTVVEYSDGKETDLVGFKKVHWRKNSEGIELIGYGWHPREHESYAFFINEPYPTYSPRWIYLSDKGEDYQVVLILHGEHFYGSLKQLKQKGDKITFSMKDVSWKNEANRTISGQVIANRGSDDVLNRMIAHYSEKQNKTLHTKH